MLRIQELEARVQSLSMQDGERNARLVAENNSIRAAWVRAKQQVANLEIMLQSLKETLDSGLNLKADLPGCPDEEQRDSETVSVAMITSIPGTAL